MSLIKYKITYDDILNIAEEVSDNELINRPGLTLEYTLPLINHKRLNEELYFRTKTNENGVRLEYHEVIELEINEIKFKFIIEE